LQCHQTPGVQTPGYFQNVPAGHSRAPFQSRAVSGGLEKAVKEMLALMGNYHAR
jgi:pyridoxine 5'-phosphate synthase PdxJ